MKKFIRVSTIVLSLVAIVAALGFLTKSHPPTSQYPPGAEWHTQHIFEFEKNPGAAKSHVFASLFWVLLVPLQFSTRVRTKQPHLHRNIGKLALIFGVVAAGSGLWLGVVMPFAGSMESIVIFVLSSAFFYTATRAYLAARKKDFKAHQEWILRAVAVGLSISTTRLVNGPLYFTQIMNDKTAFCLSFVIGMAINLGIVELYIRRKG